MFVVFEGVDGAGKSLQIKHAASLLYDRDKGANVLLTREPTADLAEIRERLAGLSDPLEGAAWFTEAFIEDRRGHVKDHIIPALRRGTHVLCDRYRGSTVAYQGAQGMDPAWLAAQQAGFRAPDLTILLDVPADVAQRRRAADASEVFDRAGTDFTQRLRGLYLRLPDLLPDDHVVVIDAGRPVGEVADAVAEALLRRLAELEL